MRQFKTPKKTLGNLDAETVASVIAASADVALVLDAKGVIRDLALGSDELSEEGYADWVGQAWADTVTVESRPKVEAILRDAAARTPRWRQVNHASARGPNVPILYSAVQIGTPNRVIAVGRDLRGISTLQQRLIDAQQSLERDYTRLRHAETRYRVLFQLASEAVLIVDAGSQRILEANPAAAKLLAASGKVLVGRSFPEGFDAESTRQIQAMLAAARTAGSTDELRVKSSEAKREFTVSASLFRQDNASYFLVRLTPTQPVAGGSLVPKSKSRLLEVVETMPDGFVVTSGDGRILTANRAFLDLAQLASEEQVRGESLDRWLGRPGVDLSVLLANLKQHGVVRLFATTMRGEYGSSSEVEISAVSALGGDPPGLGFTIRNVGRRLNHDGRAGTVSMRELPRSVEQLTELIGRVSLKDLVRESTDMIERLCIEAALELTGDNRASAAEMLGLSRQSLYVKLRRYGLGDLSGEPGA